MIRVTVAVTEGSTTRRVRIVAPSIERALALAGSGRPGCEARVNFPIEPESFFVGGAEAGAPASEPLAA